MTWHADEHTWRAYTAGTLPDPAATALEAHVIHCRSCQAGATGLLPDPEPLWRGVQAEVVRPRPSATVRLLRRIGLSESDVVILAAAGDLRLPWAVAVGGALASVVVVGALPAHQVASFLLLGPLVPALAVIAAYAATDPLRELCGPLPFSAVRIALLRTLATLAVALPSMAALSAVLPFLQPLVWSWVLPSLALTGLALVLLDRISVQVTATIVATGWASVVLVATSAGALTTVVGLVGQLACVLGTVLCTALFVRSIRSPHHAGGF